MEIAKISRWKLRTKLEITNKNTFSQHWSRLQHLLQFLTEPSFLISVCVYLYLCMCEKETWQWALSKWFIYCCEMALKALQPPRTVWLSEYKLQHQLEVQTPQTKFLIQTLNIVTSGCLTISVCVNVMFERSIWIVMVFSCLTVKAFAVLFLNQLIINSNIIPFEK